MPSSTVLNYTHAPSGWDVRITDTGLLCYQLEIRDTNDVKVYACASELSRAEDWSVPGPGGQHVDFVMSRIASGNIDTTVTGAWTLKPAP